MGKSAGTVKALGPIRGRRGRNFALRFRIGAHAAICRAMVMAIRDAREDDLAGLLGLYRHLGPDDPPPEPGRDREALAALVASPLAHLLIGEKQGAAVATCLLLIVPNLTRGGRSFGLIENVVVHATYRRQGLGKALLAAAIERARSAGCYKVMLATGRSDPGVLAFYEAAGFPRSTKIFFEIRWTG